MRTGWFSGVSACQCVFIFHIMIPSSVLLLKRSMYGPGLLNTATIWFHLVLTACASMQPSVRCCAYSRMPLLIFYFRYGGDGRCKHYEPVDRFTLHHTRSNYRQYMSSSSGNLSFWLTGHLGFWRTNPAFWICWNRFVLLVPILFLWD